VIGVYASRYIRSTGITISVGGRNSGGVLGPPVPAIPARGGRARRVPPEPPFRAVPRGMVRRLLRLQGMSDQADVTTTSYFDSRSRASQHWYYCCGDRLPRPGTRPMRSPLNPVELLDREGQVAALVVATLVASSTRGRAHRTPGTEISRAPGSLHRRLDGARPFPSRCAPRPANGEASCASPGREPYPPTGAKLPSASSDQRRRRVCALPKGGRRTSDM